MSVEVLRNLLPREVLHREVRKAIVQQSVLEDLDDALVFERCERGKFSLEAKELLRLRQFVAQDLDRFIAFVGDVEDAVNACARCFLQDRAQLIAGRKKQRGFDRKLSGCRHWLLYVSVNGSNITLPTKTGVRKLPMI